MQAIADWLEKLGMSEYAQRFAENDIDFTILSDLTDQDLEKIGVASLGHRRKPLRAIAELNVAPVPAGPVPVVTQPKDTAERRQVTVMFSDSAQRWISYENQLLTSDHKKCLSLSCPKFFPTPIGRRPQALSEAAAWSPRRGLAAPKPEHIAPAARPAIRVLLEVGFPEVPLRFGSLRCVPLRFASLRAGSDFMALGSYVSV
jgi:hypothetical protein